MARQTLLKVLEAYDKERPTNDDLKQITEKLVDMLQNRMDSEKEELKAAAVRIAQAFDTLRSEIEAKSTETEAKLSDTEKATIARLEAKMSELEGMIRQRASELRDGLDADEELILSRVIERIPAPIPGSPDTAEDVRNKLELITEEDEKLSIDAVRGLREELDTLKKRPTYGAAIGHIQTLSERILNVAETPNGVITTFSFATKPTVIMVNGARYRENKGWTWTNSQAVLDFAPATGSDVWGEI